MSTAKIDPRLEAIGLSSENTHWLNAKENFFSLHGVFYAEDEGLYRRVPKSVAESVGKGVSSLSYRTSGGRIRFLTDSPFISLRATLPAFKPLANMSITLTHGFSLYTDGKFEQRFSPRFDSFISNVDFTNPFSSSITFESSYKLFGAAKGTRLCELYFPLYGGVRDLEIGISKGSVISKAPDYKIKKPIVFYGSSITQGACVSRPGNDYLAVLARMLDADYVNLGFSGSGNAENGIIDYMSSLDASLYAYDYNLYDDRPDRVLPPHFSIYERIRSARPNTPIIFCDKPFYDYDTTYERRRDMIKNSYQKALLAGDGLVGIIPTEAMFGNEDRDSCAADDSHPNDLGAFRMANAIYPVAKRLISK